MFFLYDNQQYIKQIKKKTNFMSIFMYTTQSTMAVIEVDCINGLPICIKTCGFYSIILGKIEAKFNCL